MSGERGFSMWGPLVQGTRLAGTPRLAPTSVNLTVEEREVIQRVQAARGIEGFGNTLRVLLGEAVSAAEE